MMKVFCSRVEIFSVLEISSSFFMHSGGFCFFLFNSIPFYKIDSPCTFDQSTLNILPKEDID